MLVLARERFSPYAIGWVAGLLVLGAVIAMLFFGPLIGMVVAALPLAVVLLIQSSATRVLLLVGGGLFVLGSSSDVSPAKVVYAALVVLCAAVSAFRLLKADEPWVRAFRPLVWIGTAIGLSLAVGAVLGPPADLSFIARQSLLYLYIPLAVLVGLDAGRSLSPRAVRLIVLTVGVIAAIGFMTYWLDRRGASSLPVAGFVLYSLMLPALTFSLAIVMLGTRRPRLSSIGWVVAAVLIPVAMVVSGTRTNLVLLAAVLGVIGLQRGVRVRPAAGLLVLAATSAAITAVFPIVAAAVISKPGFLEERLQMLLTVLGGDGAADGSYAGRAQQYGIATSLIRQNPLFGIGIGSDIPFPLDTPLLSVVRLGLVGTGVVGLFLLTVVVLIRRVSQQWGATRATTAFWGFAVVFVVSIPLGTPLEDRGFGFAVLLAFMLMTSEWQARWRPPASGLVGPDAAPVPKEAAGRRCSAEIGATSS